MAQEVLSVTQINEYIRAQLDRDALLCDVAVILDFQLNLFLYFIGEVGSVFIKRCKIGIKHLRSADKV